MKNYFPKDTSKYKLIVSDFDGTLAGSEHVTTPKVQKAVKKWISSGKLFTIATGRQYLMINDECKKMGLTTPVVVRGGAEVVDPKSNEILHYEYIKKDDVSKIIKIIHDSDLYLYGIEVDNEIFSTFDLTVDFPKIKFRKIDEFQPRSIPKIHAKLKDPRYLKKADELIKNLMHNLPDVHAIATHNNQFGMGWDITSVKATKLHGIVKVMEMFDLSREEIVGVGDSYNDFPLLEAAGLKVAMGNAHEELKEIADIVVPSHDQDGVAYLIKQLLENSKS